MATSTSYGKGKITKEGRVTRGKLKVKVNPKRKFPNIKAISKIQTNG